MQVFDITEFHERLEELVELAAAGEPFQVHQDGKPLVFVRAFDPDIDIEELELFEPSRLD